MTPRDLMRLALALLGFFYFLGALASAMQLWSYLLLSPTPVSGRYLLGNFTLVGARAALGLVPLFLSGRIASWFYPRDSQPEAEPIANLNVADVYRVASFLVGIYVLVEAIRPVSTTVVVAAGGAPWTSQPVAVARVESALYLSLALLLIFGSKGIARFLSGLRYDPEEVASPRFSLRFAIIAIAICAFIFGLIRFLAATP